MARPRSFDADAVLLAAEQQFRATGYAGTNVETISAVTGLGRGSLYAAFGDKHDLFVRTVEGFCARNEAALAKALAGPDDAALGRLRAFLAAAARTGSEDGSLTCMATKASVELEHRDEAVSQRIARSFEAMRGSIAGCVAAAQRHGDLDPRADPRQVADLIFTVQRGLDVLSRTSDCQTRAGIAESAFAMLPLTRPVPGQ